MFFFFALFRRRKKKSPYKSLLIYLLPASSFSSKLTFLSTHHSPQGVSAHVSRQQNYLDPHIRTVVFICTFHHFSCPSRKANPVLMAHWQVQLETNTHKANFFDLVLFDISFLQVFYQSVTAKIQLKIFEYINEVYLYFLS